MASNNEVSLPPLAHKFVLDTIEKAMREIFDSPQVDLHTWRVANEALLKADKAIRKDAALWTPLEGRK